MDVELRDTIKAIPQLNQRQYDVTAQLIWLVTAANKLGLYDAADAIRRHLGLD